MNIPTILIISTLLALAALVLLSAKALSKFEDPVRDVSTSTIDFFAAPVRVIYQRLTALVQWLGEQAAEVFKKLDPAGEDEWVGAPVLGALFFGTTVLLSLYAEWQLMRITLPLLGFPGGGVENTDAVAMAALAVISQGLFWGGVVSEAIGWTRTTPWRNRSKRQRMVLLGVSVVSILLFCATMALMGTYRGVAMGLPMEAGTTSGVIDPFSADGAGGSATTPLSEAPDSSGARAQERYDRMSLVIPPFVNTALLLLAVATAIVGKWSVMHSIGYLYGVLCAAIRLVVYVLHTIFEILHQMYETLRDPLVGHFTHLGHLSTKELFDWHAKRGEEAFQQDAADIRTAQDAHESGLTEELLRRVSEVNGRGPSGSRQIHKGDFLVTDRNDNPFLPESKKPDDILAPYRRGGGHVTPRKEAGLAELRAHEDYHRHMLALRIEREIGALAILSVAELETIVERTGLEIMQDAQDTMAEAESTLNPEYLAKFKKFTEYAHGQGMRDILEIQALGAENVREIAANITTYRHLPPEKKPLIDRILGIFRHA